MQICLIISWYVELMNNLLMHRYLTLTVILLLLQKKATLLNYAVGDVIYAQEDPPNGIFIVVSGVVKIHYEPSYELLKVRRIFSTGHFDV